MKESTVAGKHVQSEGSNFECQSDSLSLESKIRIVFKDSKGWHILSSGTNTDGMNSFILANRNWKHFDPYVNDVSNVEAGTTLEPSEPSFTCITWIGTSH